MKYRKNIILFIAIIYSCISFAQTKGNVLSNCQSEVLHSNILNEKRTINIFLPNNYQANDTVTYPVIYVLDGGMEEDFFILRELFVLIPNLGLRDSPIALLSESREISENVILLSLFQTLIS
ncbi:alpha/beta hydrolase-fold protein [Sphingobacterium sp. E70]|uniref:alpha/beta hydrolase-fold protein n=1 Tax=Sphingobacterium sp. E70 TaxID=2853439 RepID=UPI00211BEDEF|nr:alpha/beta hydrolase-fold protein [Sphingobacterium sp. E70]ULT26951.1 alpha/beta hydrolase-fold protein [Sphingobacterium sp. E70]